ncbi:putative KRI1-like family protein [Giardia duodenalis assemblage B]|nr:Putative KRI1-like family protein [Giardia intestinalis]KWX15588.1 putative KRI1-like family protein [Giardia intestinalis assemblage B]
MMQRASELRTSHYQDERSSDHSVYSETTDEGVNPVHDVQILKTLAMIKARDPRIFDKDVRFFSEDALPQAPANVKAATDKLQHSRKDEFNAIARNMVSQRMAERGDEAGDPAAHLTNKERRMLSKIPLHADAESIKVCQDWVVSQTGEVHAEDKADKFLMNYLQSQAWLQDEVSERSSTDLKDVSDSEKQLEAQDLYEDAYNHRKEEDTRQIINYARNVFRSIRETRSKRAEARQRKKERVANDALMRKSEIAKKKAEKRAEIMDELKKLAEESGIPLEKLQQHPLFDEKDFDGNDLREVMDQLFDDNFYNDAPENEDPGEKPVFSSMSEDVSEEDYENNFENSTGSDSRHANEQDEHEAELEPHIKAKLDRHMNELNMMDEVDYVPGFGPVRFRYTSVAPNNFGLTDEDLLMVPEKELDKIMATRHMVPYAKHDPEMNYSNFWDLRKQGIIRGNPKNVREEKLKEHTRPLRGYTKKEPVGAARQDMLRKAQITGSQARLDAYFRK